MENIYDDLKSVDLENKVTFLEERNEMLENHVKSLNEDIQKLCQELLSMKDKEINLKKNISELFNTAKLEIKRKDNIIADLRRQLDDYAFRRGKRNNPEDLNSERKRPKYNSYDLKEDQKYTLRASSGKKCYENFSKSNKIDEVNSRKEEKNEQGQNEKNQKENKSQGEEKNQNENKSQREERSQRGNIFQRNEGCQRRERCLKIESSLSQQSSQRDERNRDVQNRKKDRDYKQAQSRKSQERNKEDLKMERNQRGKRCQRYEEIKKVEKYQRNEQNVTDLDEKTKISKTDKEIFEKSGFNCQFRLQSQSENVVNNSLLDLEIQTQEKHKKETYLVEDSSDENIIEILDLEEGEIISPVKTDRMRNFNNRKNVQGSKATLYKRKKSNSRSPRDNLKRRIFEENSRPRKSRSNSLEKCGKSKSHSRERQRRSKSPSEKRYIKNLRRDIKSIAENYRKPNRHPLNEERITYKKKISNEVFRSSERSKSPEKLPENVETSRSTRSRSRSISNKSTPTESSKNLERRSCSMERSKSIKNNFEDNAENINELPESAKEIFTSSDNRSNISEERSNNLKQKSTSSEKRSKSPEERSEINKEMFKTTDTSTKIFQGSVKHQTENFVNENKEEINKIRNINLEPCNIPWRLININENSDDKKGESDMELDVPAAKNDIMVNIKSFSCRKIDEILLQTVERQERDPRVKNDCQEFVNKMVKCKEGSCNEIQCKHKSRVGGEISKSDNEKIAIESKNVMNKDLLEGQNEGLKFDNEKSIIDKEILRKNKEKLEIEKIKDDVIMEGDNKISEYIKESSHCEKELSIASELPKNKEVSEINKTVSIKNEINPEFLQENTVKKEAEKTEYLEEKLKNLFGDYSYDSSNDESKDTLNSGSLEQNSFEKHENFKCTNCRGIIVCKNEAEETIVDDKNLEIHTEHSSSNKKPIPAMKHKKPGTEVVKEESVNINKSIRLDKTTDDEGTNKNIKIIENIKITENGPQIFNQETFPKLLNAIQYQKEAISPHKNIHEVITAITNENIPCKNLKNKENTNKTTEEKTVVRLVRKDKRLVETIENLKRKLISDTSQKVKKTLIEIQEFNDSIDENLNESGDGDFNEAFIEKLSTNHKRMINETEGTNVTEMKLKGTNESIIKHTNKRVIKIADENTKNLDKGISRNDDKIERKFQENKSDTTNKNINKNIEIHNKNIENTENVEKCVYKTEKKNSPKEKIHVVKTKRITPIKVELPTNNMENINFNSFRETIKDKQKEMSNIVLNRSSTSKQSALLDKSLVLEITKNMSKENKEDENCFEIPFSNSFGKNEGKLEQQEKILKQTEKNVDGFKIDNPNKGILKQSEDKFEMNENEIKIKQTEVKLKDFEISNKGNEEEIAESKQIINEINMLEQEGNSKKVENKTIPIFSQSNQNISEYLETFAKEIQMDESPKKLQTLELVTYPFVETNIHYSNLVQPIKLISGNTIIFSSKENIIKSSRLHKKELSKNVENEIFMDQIISSNFLTQESSTNIRTQELSKSKHSQEVNKKIINKEFTKNKNNQEVNKSKKNQEDNNVSNQEVTKIKEINSVNQTVCVSTENPEVSKNVENKGFVNKEEIVKNTNQNEIIKRRSERLSSVERKTVVPHSNSTVNPSSSENEEMKSFMSEKDSEDKFVKSAKKKPRISSREKENERNAEGLKSIDISKKLKPKIIDSIKEDSRKNNLKKNLLAKDISTNLLETNSLKFQGIISQKNAWNPEVKLTNISIDHLKPNNTDIEKILDILHSHPSQKNIPKDFSNITFDKIKARSDDVKICSSVDGKKQFLDESYCIYANQETTGNIQKDFEIGFDDGINKSGLTYLKETQDLKTSSFNDESARDLKRDSTKLFDSHEVYSNSGSKTGFDPKTLSTCKKVCSSKTTLGLKSSTNFQFEELKLKNDETPHIQTVEVKKSPIPKILDSKISDFSSSISQIKTPIFRKSTAGSEIDKEFDCQGKIETSCKLEEATNKKLKVSNSTSKEIFYGNSTGISESKSKENIAFKSGEKTNYKPKSVLCSKNADFRKAKINAANSKSSKKTVTSQKSARKKSSVNETKKVVKKDQKPSMCSNVNKEQRRVTRSSLKGSKSVVKNLGEYFSKEVPNYYNSNLFDDSFKDSSLKDLPISEDLSVTKELTDDKIKIDCVNTCTNVNLLENTDENTRVNSSTLSENESNLKSSTPNVYRRWKKISIEIID